MNIMLCPFVNYKDSLGIPRKGVHSYRFLDTAIVDLVLALLLAILISYFTKIPLELSIVLVLVMGIILHMLFGVETNSTKFLGIFCGNKNNV